jgi:hypothetical protein
MAVQSSFYEGTGLDSRTFPSTKHIPTKAHMAIWLQLVSDNSWVQMSISEYQLINNSCVLNTLLSKSIYNGIEVRVADEPDELTTSPSDISVVAGIATEVHNVSNIKDEVVVVESISAAISSVAADKTTLDSIYADKIKLYSIYGDSAAIRSIYADKTKLDSLFTDKSTLDSLYADKVTLDSLFADKATLDSLKFDKATLDSLYLDKAKLDSVFADKTTLDGLYASKTGIDAVYSNLAEVLLADDNAAIATTKAGEASALALQVAADKVVVENNKAIVVQKVEESNDNLALSLQYRNEAVAAKQSIDGYVIPTNATYTPETIDTKIQNTRLESFLGFNF